MKIQSFGNLIAMLFIFCTLTSCKKKQNTENKIIHVDKVLNVKAYPGRNRVKLNWRISGDVSKCRITWNADKNLKEISTTPGKIDYEFIIDSLPEQNYNFSITAFNKEWDASEKVNIESKSYGDVYESSLKNRSFKGIFFNNVQSATLVNWEIAQSAIVNSEIRYKDELTNEHVITVSPIAESTTLENLKPKGKFTLRTLYLPETNAIDTFRSAIDTVSVNADDADEIGYHIVTLKADGPGNTYELLGQVLGGSPEETPDCAHPAFGRHIAEEFDTQLNENVFAFFAHVTPDDDRCGATDRQRTEIKTYGSSPNTVKALRGDEMLFKWKFKLAAGFQPSSSFTHIHQIKAGDGDNDGSPLMTITPRYGSSGDKLEIIHTGDNSASGQGKVTSIDLEQLKGIWVEVVEKIKFDTHGTYELTISKVSNGEQVLHYVNNDIDFWRTGATFIRPKWGIYRSLNDAGRLRDEKVLFADFKIGKK